MEKAKYCTHGQAKYSDDERFTCTRLLVVLLLMSVCMRNCDIYLITLPDLQ